MNFRKYTHMAALLCVSTIYFCAQKNAAAKELLALEDVLKYSVGVVEVHGFDKSSHEVTVQGSGFFISIEGYFVTARHLLADALKAGALPESITYSVKMPSEVGSPSAPASNYWVSPAGDEMVLSVRSENFHIRPLKPNHEPRGGLKIGVTPIYTGGYPENYSFVMDSGVVRSFSGPKQSSLPLWMTNMSFKHGQSGSPVVTGDGEVVGLVTAVDLDATTFGVLTPVRSVPPYFWDHWAAPSEKTAPKGTAGQQ